MNESPSAVEIRTSEIRSDFETRRDKLSALAERLELHLENSVFHKLPRLDRVYSRVKSTESFVEKAMKPSPNGVGYKYKMPFEEIQDQIGARAVLFFLSDVDDAVARVRKYLSSIEHEVKAPQSVDAFGYSGVHFIVHIPSDVLAICPDPPVTCFELQIKTVFQHAWGQAAHDIGYKPNADISADNRRRIAYTAAQSWGADRMFLELFRELDHCNQQNGPT